MTMIDAGPIPEHEADLSPAIRRELEHALRREVEQALQPVLADFRRQSVRAVRQQVENGQGWKRVRKITRMMHRRPIQAARRDRRRDGEMANLGQRTATWRGRPTSIRRRPIKQVVSEVTDQVTNIVEELGSHGSRRVWPMVAPPSAQRACVTASVHLSSARSSRSSNPGSTSYQTMRPAERCSRRRSAHSTNS